MNIAIFEAEPWEQEIYQGLPPGSTVVFRQEPLDESNAGQYTDAEVISTFIYSNLDRRVLSQFPGLRFIATRSTGYDHIDVDYCRQKEIRVSNVPDYGSCTVAEHVFGLLLAISHHLIEAIDRTRKGDFSILGLKGFDLNGKVLGVIGTGSIGMCVIRIARGFSMEVRAFDLKPRVDAARQLGFSYHSMEDVLKAADVITLHVPFSEKTRNLISAREFELMKDGAVLINTSRGAIVEPQALLKALADGKIAAAGLDVLTEEPLIREEAELVRSMFQQDHDLRTLLADHVLLRMRNVYITPHSAFYTQEALLGILNTTVENIRSFASGKPINLVA
ncbi:MAG: hydroxyacid dehydrogenase [Desulfomonilia bacterium]|jgi:D-lactate dehydrogenase